MMLKQADFKAVINSMFGLRTGAIHAYDIFSIERTFLRI